ncbi:MAG TPA: hypothetical protein VGM88_33325 [Kofleriaceae bacterium]|jgi:hypothetical protein
MPVAQASIFDDLGGAIAEVTELQGVVRSMASGASAELRGQIEILMNTKAAPLVERANQIARERIDQLAGEAIHVLGQARAVMNELIEHARSSAQRVVDQVFQRLNDTLSVALDRLDSMLGAALCAISPDGNGIVIRGVHGRFVEAGPGEVLVARPASTQCYQVFPEALNDPATAWFSGIEYYRGELCEAELTRTEIDPRDGMGVRKLGALYERMAMLARGSLCFLQSEPSV